MKRYISLPAVVLLLAWLASWADAGRVGGPATTVDTLPAGMSMYYDVAFAAGEPAVAAIAGDGGSPLQVVIYDADGHVAVGDGRMDRRIAWMMVYRTGTFRIEVRNLSQRPCTFLLTTN